MNDMHEDSYKCALMRSRWKINNQHLLIGKDWPDRYGSNDKDAFSWMMDYAQREVRDHRLAIIEEICTNYDVDGFEMDFLRHPYYFKKGQEQRGMGLMNDFIQKVRTRLNEIGCKKGRKIMLHVRVPETLEMCTEIGLDVRSWIKQGWVDMVTPMSPGYLDTGADNDAPGNYIAWLSKRYKIYGFPFRGKWLDIGDLVSYLKANARKGR